MVIEDDVRWAEGELKAAVRAYLEMLRLEVDGKAFTKTDFNRRLRAGALSKRTESSVEYRMQNISAVLDAMGRRWIAGYRPAANVGPANETRLGSLIAEVEGEAKPQSGLAD